MGMLDLLTTNTTVLLPAPTLSSWKTQGIHVDTCPHGTVATLCCFFNAIAITGMASWLLGSHL
jgi:hypothetical protein